MLFQRVQQRYTGLINMISFSVILLLTNHETPYSLNTVQSFCLPFQPITTLFTITFYRPGADLIKLFPLLLPLRTGRTEIKCAGTSVLAYAGVLRIPRWCRQNSHVTCSKTRWRSTASMCGHICIAWFITEYSKVLSFTCLCSCSGVRRVL